MRGFLLALPCLLASAATNAEDTIRISGRITNWQQLIAGMEASTIGIRSEGWLEPNTAPDPATGRFEGSITCIPVPNAHGTWVDIEFHAFTNYGPGRRSMFIRAPFASHVDLGEFAWRPSRYRLKADGLVIDTAVPRDTVIGDPFGTHLLLRPLNPAPGERIELVFGYITSGEPRQVDHELRVNARGTHAVDFTFAVHTNTVVFTESWNETVTPIDLGELLPGRYRLRQKRARGEALRDIDFLLEDELIITVVERREP